MSPGPVRGLLLALRLAWRLVYLPHRDWRPRADERDRCVPAGFATDAGEPVCVLAATVTPGAASARG